MATTWPFQSHPSKAQANAATLGVLATYMMCSVGLQVRSHDDRRVVACESACFAFDLPRYCCTGIFGSPQVCKPTAYIFLEFLGGLS